MFARSRFEPVVVLGITTMNDPREAIELLLPRRLPQLSRRSTHQR